MTLYCRSELVKAQLAKGNHMAILPSTAPIPCVYVNYFVYKQLLSHNTGSFAGGWCSSCVPHAGC